MSVGNYRISVVFGTDELKSRIDWSKFNLPQDLDERIETINDPNIFGFEHKAIIVAVK